MKYKRLLTISLSMFDGGGAAGGAAGSAGAAASGADSGASGENTASPAVAGRGKKSGEFQNVLFGKQTATADGDRQQAQAQSSDAGRDKNPGVQTTSDALEEKRRTYRQMMDGEFRDIYAEDTQNIINRRFKETQTLADTVKRQQPIMDLLMQRYHIDDGDASKIQAALENDDAYWSEAADEAGMSVEQFKRVQKLEREHAALLQEQNQQRNRQLAQQTAKKWEAEAAQTQTLYPSFDLVAEIGNPQFLAMLHAGVPVQHAYEVIHMDEIKAGIAQMQAKATEKQVVAGIRAKGARPQENGISSQSAFTVKDDVSKLTKKDRAEIARRVARGEHIEF